MINVSKNSTKENLIKQIKEEIKNVNSQITSQTNNKKKLISCLRDYVFCIDYNDIDVACTDISNLSNILKECDRGINNYEILLADILSIKVKAKNSTPSALISMIDEYNKNYARRSVYIKEVNEKVSSFYKDFSKGIVSIEESNEYENTLLISEVSGKVILPYTNDEVYAIMNKNKKYKSFQDVVDTLYTIPLSYYKNPFKARFQEAYKLVKERENGSSRQALDLAMELAFNSKLNPAVISACKTLDVLDIYLSCLEYNELSDFHFFKIKYEMNPVDEKVKKSHNLKPFKLHLKNKTMNEEAKEETT